MRRDGRLSRTVSRFRCAMCAAAIGVVTTATSCTLADAGKTSDGASTSASTAARSDLTDSESEFVPPTGLTDPASTACQIDRFPVLADVPAGSRITTQVTQSVVSVRVGLPGDGPSSHLWMTVDIGVGGEPPEPDAKRRTFRTGDGEIEAMYRVEPNVGSPGDLDNLLRRVDWNVDGLHVSAQALNLELEEVTSLLSGLRLMPREAFLEFQRAQSIPALCA